MTFNNLTTTRRRFGFAAFLSTQFLGALNDNVSKLLVICFGTRALGAATSEASTFMSLAAAMFIFPFLICSSVAGYLADRFTKRQILIWTKVAEIVIMVVGLLFAKLGFLYSMLVVLFFLGVQSAFFSPAKYGFLPETHTVEELPKANGLTQLWTFLAIILGGYVGGVLSAHSPNNLSYGFVWCVILAVIGFATSLAITPTPPGNPQCHLDSWNPISPHIRTFKQISADPILLAAALGNSFFWFLGTTFQLVIIPLCQNTLHGDDKLVGYMQGVAALGIGIGCTLAGILSKRRITYNWVAPAAFAMAIIAFGMAIFGKTATGAYVFIALLGISSGFFQLPLSTAIQHRSPSDQLGRYLGACNVSDCVAMLLSSLVLWILQSKCHFQATGVFGVLGIMLVITAIIFYNCYNRKNVHDE